jgi:hypothetical protein
MDEFVAPDLPSSRAGRNVAPSLPHLECIPPVGASLLAMTQSQPTSMYLSKTKTPLLPKKAEAAEAQAPQDQCMNKAIRMMIGIGTPRKNNSNERMRVLLG